jgi:hypothetical protein
LPGIPPDPRTGTDLERRDIVIHATGDTTPSIFCISRPGREPITDVDSAEAGEGADRDGTPGRFHMDEATVASDGEPEPDGTLVIVTAAIKDLPNNKPKLYQCTLDFEPIFALN